MQKTIDGISLAYDDAGSGDTIVLLHGFPFDRTIWDEQFDDLARHARVIRIDLRGSGESACGNGPALMETLAGDVFGLLDALNVERAVIAGHSMGGYVALAFFRMYAERVAGLALVASQVGADTPARATQREAEAALFAQQGLAAAAQAIVGRAVAGPFAASVPATLRRLRAIVARQDPTGAAAQMIGMKERVDSGDLLEDIAVPVLILGGADDPLIAPATLERTAAALADCEYISLPGVAHLPMLEAPAPTTAALERLLRRSVTAAADRQSVRADPA